MKKEFTQYNTISVEAAKTGWIVKDLKDKKKPAEIFIRWESVVKKLEHELMTKGDADRN